MLHGYLSFLRAEARWLSFGLLMTFVSSLGQTYFISLFGQEIRTDLDLSHTAFSSLYAIGTVTGGLVIFWLGKSIDSMPLRLFSSLTLVGLVAAGFFLATAFHPLMLLPAFMLLRLCGQGLSSHIAMTSMGRWFAKNRGKAISIANLGMPLGEALLPSIVVALLTVMSWRQSWWLFSLVILVAFVPLLVCLVWRGGRQPLSVVADSAEHDPQRSWTRREVMTDIRFWLMLPAIVGPSWIFTGIFFHQVEIVAAKGWSFQSFAAAYLAYALLKVMIGLVSGVFVDRFTARRLSPLTMPVMSLALVLLIISDSILGAWLFMAFLGFHVGMHMTAISALWPELYGRAYLGSIKSLVMSLGVIASAIGPPIFGLVLDWGTGTQALLWICAIYGLVAAWLMRVALRPQSATSRLRSVPALQDRPGRQASSD